MTARKRTLRKTTGRRKNQPASSMLKEKHIGHIDDPHLADLLEDVRDTIATNPWLTQTSICNIVAPMYFCRESPIHPAAFSRLLKSGRIAFCQEGIVVPALAAAYFPPTDIHIFEIDYGWRFRAEPDHAEVFLDKLNQVAEYAIETRPALVRGQNYPRLWKCAEFDVTVDPNLVEETWFNPPVKVEVPSRDKEYKRLMARTVNLWKSHADLINRIIGMQLRETGRSTILRKYDYNEKKTRIVPSDFSEDDRSISEDSMVETLMTLYANFNIPNPEEELKQVLVDLICYHARHKTHWEKSIASGAVSFRIASFDFDAVQETWGDFKTFCWKQRAMSA